MEPLNIAMSISQVRGVRGSIPKIPMMMARSHIPQVWKMSLQRTAYCFQLRCVAFKTILYLYLYLCLIYILFISYLYLVYILFISYLYLIYSLFISYLYFVYSLFISYL